MTAPTADARSPGRRLLAFLLGLAFTMVCLEVGLRIANGLFRVAQAQRAAGLGTSGEVDEIRLLAVGESTTAVAGNDTNTLLVPSSSWPAQLEEVLNERQQRVRFRVVNAAVMGGTSTSALDLLRVSLPEVQPHMVIAMMGIMDTPADVSRYEDDLPDALRSLRTVQLGLWLAETLRVEHSRNPTDVQTVADLPASGRDGTLMPTGRGYFELRLNDDPVALDQAQVATYLHHTGFTAEAEERLRALVAEEDVGHVALAQLLLGLDRGQDALAVIEAAIAAHPEEGLYFNTLAEIHLRQGRHEQAHAALDRGAASAEAFVEPEIVADFRALERSAIFLSAGEPQAALDAALAAKGGPERAYKNVLPSVFARREKAIGRAYVALGDWTQAERHLLLAMEAEPRRAVSLMWSLTEVYRASGQVDKEAALRQELLARTGRMGEYLELARLLQSQGDGEAVPGLIDDAVRQTPSVSRAFEELDLIAGAEGFDVMLVQYPMFSLDILHAWAPPHAGRHYVDTEDVFDGVVGESYADAGLPVAFSHYSKSGARRVAERIADQVLKVYGLGPAP